MPDALLLVGDDRTALDAIGAQFQHLGYAVWRETRGAAAVATYRHTHPDVVLLDLSRSDGSWLAVLERLRRAGAAVIVLTTQGDRDGAVDAMLLGAENVLTRPVDVALLGAAIARVAEKARLSRENARLVARVNEIEHPPTARRYRAHTLSEVERKHIERALRHHGGNRTRAALELGISRATLINKIKAYSLNL